MPSSRLKAALAAVAGVCALTLTTPGAAPAAAEPVPAPQAEQSASLVRLVSTAADGTQADAPSTDAVLSGDGRTAVFFSEARNLVPGQAVGSGGLQLYAKDLRTGKVDLVSAAPDGTPAYEPGYTRAVSADGRFVVFDSPSATLDPHDRHDGMDVFVRDRRKGTTRVLTTTPVSLAGRTSFLPSISANGRYVAFTSHRDDLVPDDTNAQADIFVRDRATGGTRRVSVASDGAQAASYSSDPVISEDGRRVAFITAARNLFPWPAPPTAVSPARTAMRPPPPHRTIAVHDLRTGRTEAGAYDLNGIPARVDYGLHFSPDGRYVLFNTAGAIVPGDESGGPYNFYSRDLRTGSYQRLAARPDGGRPTGTVEGTALSADNRTAYFTSHAPDLVPDDTNGTWDVFARDLRTGRITRLSTNPDGSSPAAGSFGPSPDRSGRHVLFTSDSAELVPGDTNHVRDVFVRRLR